MARFIQHALLYFFFVMNTTFIFPPLVVSTIFMLGCREATNSWSARCRKYVAKQLHGDNSRRNSSNINSAAITTAGAATGCGEIGVDSNVVRKGSNITRWRRSRDGEHIDYVIGQNCSYQTALRWLHKMSMQGYNCAVEK